MILFLKNMCIQIKNNVEPALQHISLYNLVGRRIFLQHYHRVTWLKDKKNINKYEHVQLSLNLFLYMYVKQTFNDANPFNKKI